MCNLKRKIIQPLGYDRPIVDKEFLVLEKQRVLDIVGEGKKVLEVGCSTGSFIKHLRDQECTVTCIEIDVEAAQNLIREAGYKIQKREVVAWTVPFAGKLRKLPLLRYLAPIWEKTLISLYPNLCGAFFLFKAAINNKADER